MMLPSGVSYSSRLNMKFCDVCHRGFKDYNNYREHRFQEHGVKYPNVKQCPMCSYATLLKSKYDAHIRCHANNMVIKCSRCNFSTINVRHMSKHERMHAEEDSRGGRTADTADAAPRLSPAHAHNAVEPAAAPAPVAAAAAAAAAPFLFPLLPMMGWWAQNNQSETAAAAAAATNGAENGEKNDNGASHEMDEADNNNIADKEIGRRAPTMLGRRSLNGHRRQRRCDDSADDMHADETPARSEGGYLCTLCNAGFGSEEALMAHIQEHDEDEEVGSSSEPADADEALATTDGASSCSASSPPAEPTDEDADTSKNLDRPTTDGVLVSPGFLRLPSNQYQCTLCSYVTRHRSNVYLHFRKHTGEKPYWCSGCNARFTQLPSLKGHVQAYHNGDRSLIQYDRRTSRPRSSPSRVYLDLLKQTPSEDAAVVQLKALRRNVFRLLCGFAPQLVAGSDSRIDPESANVDALLQALVETKSS